MLRSGTGAALGLAIMALAAAAPLPSQAEDVAARIKTVTGDVAILRGGQRLPVDLATPVFEADTVETGADGSVGLVFTDNTMISAGPSTTLLIEDYAFDPAEEELGFVASLNRGTMQFFSGVIGALSPEQVTINTPTSSIGVRGTRLLVRAAEQ